MNRQKSVEEKIKFPLKTELINKSVRNDKRVLAII